MRGFGRASSQVGPVRIGNFTVYAGFLLPPIFTVVVNFRYNFAHEFGKPHRSEGFDLNVIKKENV